MAAVGDLGGNERFNSDAQLWDDNPYITKMSREAWKAIPKYVPHLFKKGAAEKPDVLEIGCGTGLLSMEVAPAVNRLVAVDAAEGMIQMLSSKLRKPDAPKNVVPLAILLEDPEDKRLPPADEANPDGPRLKYDLVISHLVLHHIPDLKSVLQTMIGCLKKGGMVALTDFEDFGPEARKFHPECKMAGVERHGIPQKWIADLMKEVGFEDVETAVAWEHIKLVEKFPGEWTGSLPLAGQGERMKFSYIICLGRKG